MALLALVFLAPLPFGCIEDWSHWILVFLLGSAFCLFLRARIPFRLDRRLTIALGLSLAYLGWLAFQMVPLPPGLLSSISPSAARLHSIGVPGLGDADASGYAYPDLTQLPGGEGPEGITWIAPRFSPWRSLSLYPYGTYRIFWLTVALVAFVMMGSSLFREERHRRHLAYVLIALGAFQALYGSIETLSGRQHILFYEKRFYTDVATGTLINRNHFAGMLNMVIPLAAVFLFAGRFFTGRKPARSPAREPLLAAAVIVMGIGVALSRSRMGLASTIAGLLALTLLFVWTRAGAPTGAPGGRWRLLGAMALPIALLALVVLYSVGIDPGTFDRFQTVTSDLNPEAIRPALWTESLPVARDFLLTGAGVGAFVNALNPYLKTLPIDDFWLFQHAHNDYLEWIVMLGIVGIAIGGAAFLVHVSRRPRSVIQLGALVGMATLLIHSLTDFNLSIPSNGLVACALMILIAPAASPGRDGRSRSRPHDRRRALLVLAALVLIVWPGRSLVAALVYRPHYNRVTHLPAVRAALAMASAVEPANDSFWRFRADGEREAALRLSPGELDVGGDLREQIFEWQMSQLEGLARAQALYLESLDRNPLNHELHFNVARVGSEIRRLERLADLPRSDAAGDSVLAPHLSSAALGPTAYSNLARLGVLVWNEREHLGAGSEPHAIDLMGRAAAHRRETGTDWIDMIVLETKDPAILSRLDQALEPYATSYFSVLENGAPEGDLRTCVDALFTLAQLREAEIQFENHLSRHYVLDPEALSGLRERVRKLRVSAGADVVLEDDGPCNDGRELHAIVTERSTRLLESVDMTSTP